MGVYIKGMKMPKNLGVSVTIYPDGRVIEYLNYDVKRQLGTAFPVPDHGRLIDVSELEKRLYDYGTGTTFPIDWSDIANAPTVIEAEEGE